MRKITYLSNTCSWSLTLLLPAYASYLTFLAWVASYLGSRPPLERTAMDMVFQVECPMEHGSIDLVGLMGIQLAIM